MCLAGGGGQLCPAVVTAHRALRPPASPPSLHAEVQGALGGFAPGPGGPGQVAWP